MKKTLVIWAVAVLLLIVGSAKADLTNGSFEYGLTGWSYVIDTGDVQAVSSYTDTDGEATGTTYWEPTDGSYFGLLKAGDEDQSVHQLYQTFTASAGEVLTFDYFWDSNDYVYPSYAYDDTGRGTLLSGAGIEGTVLSTLFSHSVSSDPDNFWGTDWMSVSYTFADSGTYTLLFEVWNDGDPYYPSYVGIDNVFVTPVPAAALLGLLGFGVAGLKLRKLA